MEKRLAVATISFLLSGACVSGWAADGPAGMDEGEVAVGLGYLDGGDYRYGRYSGLTDTGPELFLDLTLMAGADPDSGETGYWRLEGDRLGLEAPRLLLEAGQQGAQRLRLNYRETPRYSADDAVTPVRGAGSSTLTLPAGWQAEDDTTAGMTTLEESLVEVNLWQERRTLSLDYQHRLNTNWTLNADFRRDRLEGTRALGGSTGSTGGNVRALLLPAPVDYETQVAALSLAYTGEAYRWSLSYQGSFFNNGSGALVWPTPFAQHPQWAEGVGYPEGRNRMALEPDNQAHQLRAQGSLTFAGSTRLHGDVAVGRQTQDEAFLPYTLNEDLTVTEPLPRDSLDARVDTTRANLRLTSRPLRNLNLVTRLRYRDRDNKTPRDDYQRVRGDAGDQQAFIDARLNRPYSLTESEASAEAGYRLTPGLRLEGGYEYTDTERDYSEVRHTDEQGLKAGLRSTGFDAFALSLDLRHLRRRTDEYVGNRPYRQTHVPGSVDAEDYENHPLLRKYYLTDRDRDQARVRVDWYPAQRLTLGMALTHNDDDYPSGFMGLNQSRMLSATLDVAYAASDNLHLSGFLSRDRYRSDQSGRSFRGSVPADALDPERDWHLEARDRFDVLGVSVDWENVEQYLGGLSFLGEPGRLDLSLELLHSRSRGQLDMSTGPALENAPIPELSTRLQSARIEARYALSDRSSLRFGFEHERYRSRDFAYDGVAPDAVAGVLLLGESSPGYNATWTTLAYQLQF